MKTLPRCYSGGQRKYGSFIWNSTLLENNTDRTDFYFFSFMFFLCLRKFQQLYSEEEFNKPYLFLKDHGRREGIIRLISRAEEVPWSFSEKSFIRGCGFNNW